MAQLRRLDLYLIIDGQSSHLFVSKLSFLLALEVGGGVEAIGFEVCRLATGCPQRTGLLIGDERGTAIGDFDVYRLR